MALGLSEHNEVHSSTSGSSSGGSGSITVATGATLAIFISWGGGAAATVSSLSDGTHTYNARTKLSNGGGEGLCCQWFICNSATAGTYTLTLTMSTNVDRPSFCMFEITGADTTTPLDSEATGTGSDSNPTASITTIAADTIIMTGSRNLWGNTYSAGGWSPTLHTSNFRFGSQSKIVSSVQTGLTANSTQGGSNQWVHSVLAIKAAGGGGGGGGNPYYAYRQQRHIQPAMRATPSGLLLPDRRLVRPDWAAQRQGVICA